MKTNQSTAATPIAAQSTLISPVLLECMAQLREVHRKIINFYENNEDIGLKDYTNDPFTKIDTHLTDAADDLSEFIRYEVLGNTFYAE